MGMGKGEGQGPMRPHAHERIELGNWGMQLLRIPQSERLL